MLEYFLTQTKSISKFLITEFVVVFFFCQQTKTQNIVLGRITTYFPSPNDRQQILLCK